MWMLTKSEMKFSLEKFAIDAEYASRLREKVVAFRRETGVRGNCHAQDARDDKRKDKA